jgi:hypothetical protein
MMPNGAIGVKRSVYGIRREGRSRQPCPGRLMLRPAKRGRVSAAPAAQGVAGGGAAMACRSPSSKAPTSS